MKKDEFKEWLQIQFPDTKTTVNNRIANCRNVEKYYGDLDDHFKKDKCSTIINELIYSTEDGRKKIPQRHKVPITGDIRTGSATLKLAIKLYVEFRECQNELFASNLTYYEDISDSNSDGAIILTELRKQLNEFNFDKNKHKDVTVLQIEITDFLNERINQFLWKIEHKPSPSFKDSIDIFGSSDNCNFKIAIELDAHRADQVAKKFLSRSALFIKENFIYLSLCYPGTKKMNKNECIKYFAYCSTISKALSDSSMNRKLYAGVIMN